MNKNDIKKKVQDIFEKKSINLDLKDNWDDILFDKHYSYYLDYINLIKENKLELDFTNLQNCFKLDVKLSRVLDKIIRPIEIKLKTKLMYIFNDDIDKIKKYSIGKIKEKYKDNKDNDSIKKLGYNINDIEKLRILRNSISHNNQILPYFFNKKNLPGKSKSKKQFNIYECIRAIEKLATKTYLDDFNNYIKNLWSDDKRKEFIVYSNLLKEIKKELFINGNAQNRHNKK